MTQTVKKLPSMQETQVPSLGWEDPLERGKTTHSSFLAWRIPWTEKPGRLQSMGSKELDRTELITLSSYYHNLSSTPLYQGIKLRKIVNCYVLRLPVL